MKPVWNRKAQFEDFKEEAAFDCYVAESLLSEGRYTPTLENTRERYKADDLEKVMQIQKERLSELPKLEALFYDVEMPLTPVLWQMEQHGITLDTKRLEKIGKEIDHIVNELASEINTEVGYPINLNSSQQVGTYLVEKAGVPLGKTKTGKYATNESEMSKFRSQFEIIDKLLSYRELTKLRSTYVESLISKVDSKSRIHTTYSQVGISTGRLSSSNPNLQNIPVTSEIGTQIKSCFMAAPGHTLLSFDYSQQELRILAHLSGEEKLIEAFREGRDVHTTTASQIFGIEYEAVTKQQRQVGKTINFGIIYGMSSYGLSVGLTIPVEEADLFIQNFYTTFPKIRSYYDEYLKQARIHDVVETLLGRRRYVYEDPKRKFFDNSTRRVLMNYPIQGSAADLMKKAMVAVQDNVLTKHKDIHLMLQIHDDLVFEVESKDTKKLALLVEEIKKTMCSVYPLTVPMEVDVKLGDRWGEMKRFVA